MTTYRKQANQLTKECIWVATGAVVWCWLLHQLAILLAKHYYG